MVPSLWHSLILFLLFGKSCLSSPCNHPGVSTSRADHLPPAIDNVCVNTAPPWPLGQRQLPNLLIFKGNL